MASRSKPKSKKKKKKRVIKFVHVCITESIVPNDKNKIELQAIKSIFDAKMRINYSNSDHVQQPRYNVPRILIGKVQEYVITHWGI